MQPKHRRIGPSLLQADTAKWIQRGEQAGISSMWLTEVVRDAFVSLQFKVNEVLVPEGEVETVSCAVFIRKAFVSSRDEHSTQEVQAEEVDTDDALYCSGQYRHADRVSTNAIACAHAL